MNMPVLQKASPFGSQWGESSAPRFTPRSSDYGQPRRSFTTKERPTPRPVVTPVTRNLKRVSSVAPSAGSGSTAALQVGQQIQHERFGIGEVIKVEGNGDNAKATIQFRNAGTKQLLLRFARFKVID